MMGSEEKQIEDLLWFAERVRAAVDDAESFKLECCEVGKQVDRLSQLLRSLVRFASTTQSLYERPIRRVMTEVARNIERALNLVKKCKRQSILRRVVTILSAADFRKVSSFLEASTGDVKWLLSIFDADGADGGGEGGGIELSLPPIASNDPILSWVWSYIANIQMGQLKQKIEAANALASLAEDNDRNKKMIVEENGVPPLLKLLKEIGSPESQIAAASALYHLANDQERVTNIVIHLGIPTIVQILGDSPMRVQIWVTSLVARMAQHDSVAQEDFARENVIRPLVTLLSFETFVDDDNDQLGKRSIHSIVQMNKEMEKYSFIRSSNRPFTNSHSNSYSFGEGSSRAGQIRKERENENPEIKLQLKLICAKALWMLAKGSLSNSRKITETKGLLCLAKLIENEKGELQYNCLMTIMEITASAESNADLRRAAFKTNSPAAKAVVEQLLRVTKEVEAPILQVPAIKSIGSLARTFPARETRVIGPLVAQLSNSNAEVTTEAAIALGKFVCPDNFLHVEHSKAIVDEFNGVPPLMRLLRGNERAQLPGLILLCYLALNAGKSESLEQARVLTALEGADRTLVMQHPELKDLVFQAIYRLNIYHAGINSQTISYVP